ncbi:nucleotidyl transferase AbiEii/AbiGii toxin family protein [Cupriavidus necator]
MAPSRKALDPQTEREVASLAHFLTLNALSQSADFDRHSLTFQGGTSLALAWASPRFSEDLDFIAGNVRPEQLSEAMHLVAREVQHAIVPFYPGAKVDLADKSGKGKQLAMFQIGITLPDVVGKVKVKTEFWQVPPDKAAHYEGVHRTLAPSGGATLYTTVRPIFNVATPKQIFFDKLNAIAHRGRLKPRDVFDVWFLTTQLRDGSAETGQAFNADKVFGDVPEFLTWMDNTAALYDQTAFDAIEKFSPWGEPVYGLPALTPENALLDCLKHAGKMWCPNADDLDEFDVPADLLEKVAEHDEQHAVTLKRDQRPC